MFALGQKLTNRKWGLMCPTITPGTDFTRAILASALGHLGEIDEARRVWRELKEINPKYSFSEHFARQPFKREEDVRRIAEGLAKAGLPT